MKKEYRIKKSHEIASIVNKRKKVANKNYILYYQISENDKIRIAISVSKKYGHAFERNKAKRITRNIVRKYLNKIKKLDLVIVIKGNLKESTYLELEQEMQFLIRLIKNKIKGEKNENIKK